MTDKPFAVIFDMDGVIIDSNPLITKAWKEFFRMYDIDLTDEQLNHYVFGRISTDTLNLVFNKPISTDEMLGYQKQIEGLVRSRYREDGLIVPGFKNFVELLIAHQIPVAIATSSPAESVAIVLDMAGATSYFTVITDSSQVQHSKPHPQIYLKTAAKLGIPPVDCCVFEDSFSGIQSAKNAGMKVIGISTTHTQEELSGLADAVIPDFTHIGIDLISELLAK
ncbi:HAD family hydrolase [Mucilaginibacter paludis]|nr:HAD family phosphatase [Mucilaginibacter paludis]